MKYRKHRKERKLCLYCKINKVKKIGSTYCSYSCSSKDRSKNRDWNIKPCWRKGIGSLSIKCNYCNKWFSRKGYVQRRCLKEGSKNSYCSNKCFFKVFKSPKFWKGKKQPEYIVRSRNEAIRSKWQDKNSGYHSKSFRQSLKRPHPWMSKILKQKWQSEDYRNEIIKAQRAGMESKPNKLESKIIALIQQNNLPYKFVGDGQIVINGFCPDFINCNGQKKIIEVFGDYWHNDRSPPHRQYANRKAIFSKYGYKTLILWEHEIKEDANKILQRIIDFDKADINV